MKRAIWLPNWIGDAVMATPAIRLLRNHFPDDELSGIFRLPNADVLAGSNLLDDMILDQTSSKFSWKQKIQFLRKLRAEQFDEIILMTNSLRTAAVARLAGIPKRIGFQRDGRGWLLTDRLQPKSRSEPNPALDEYLRLVHYACGISENEIDSNRPAIELQTTPEDEDLWNEFAGKFQLSEGSYICLNSGGAFGAAKLWPLEHFVRLAKRITNEMELPVVMLCGPAEQELAREFVKQANHPMILSLAEEAISVGLSKATVRHARLMITTDSGPRHFAAAFNVPVVTLFGPTHIAWSETNYENAIHLQQAVDCGPCQKRTCPLGHHRCMQELSVDHVYEQTCQLLNQLAGSQEQAA